MTTIGLLVSALLSILVAIGTYDLTAFAILLPLIMGVIIDLIILVGYFTWTYFVTKHHKRW